MIKILAALMLLALPGHAAELCPHPHQMDGFKTCADPAAAEKEGTVVFYSTSPETNTSALLAEFYKAFPKIEPTYIRLQEGALYARLLAERQARSHMVDALQLSDIGLVLDFQKRGGWQHYPSPEHAAFKPDQQSKPAGYWAWGSIGVVGLAYNTNLVTAEQAPKNWKDALDPRWTDSITVKAATSGEQQFGRVIDGQDAIVHTAGYAPYLELKAKGAPLGFNFPPNGLPIDVGGIGIVAEPPHPQAARLFMDWLLGVPGQTALVEEAFAYSPRADEHPPAGAVLLESLKLLYPDDWEAFEKSHPQFVKDWNKITGIR